MSDLMVSRLNLANFEMQSNGFRLTDQVYGKVIFDMTLGHTDFDYVIEVEQDGVSKILKIQSDYSFVTLNRATIFDALEQRLAKEGIVLKELGLGYSVCKLAAVDKAS